MAKGLYIRRTKVKGGPREEVYIAHRLVESVRTEKGVRQRTLLNLGKDFALPPERRLQLVQHPEQVLIRGFQRHPQGVNRTEFCRLHSSSAGAVEPEAARENGMPDRTLRRYPYVMWAGTPYQHLMAPVK